MTNLKSDFLNILTERGFIHQMTDSVALDEKMATDAIKAYIGFDCTGPSLHVGSLVQIMMLRWLQKCGHKPIVLLGGGTTKVGDPSGKDESRRMLTDYVISDNMLSIKSIFEQFISFGDGKSDAMLVNNADWLDELKYIEFLRDIGPHFTINRMMTFESVKLRLERENPMTFLEFNYMILQAYDFLELSKRHNCILQFGGSDQWGNIINGIELTRRAAKKEVYGVTTPLITTADGGKMGKTMNGAIWLNEAQLSAYDYWQFWRNTQDADVGRFLKLFTELPMDEIARLESLEGSDINEAKKILAHEATKMCRGEAAALAAAETAHTTFVQGGAGDDLPTITITQAQLEFGYGINTAFIDVGFCTSNGEARKLASGGGLKINDQKVEDTYGNLTIHHFVDGLAKLSKGKKHHAILELK
jgi:tyrosyl-tRNA synthetase